MHDEPFADGLLMVVSICIFVLGMLLFNALAGVGFKGIKNTKAQVDDRQLVTAGEFTLNEPILLGSDLIFFLEDSIDSDVDVYINGSRIDQVYLKKAKQDATIYNGYPFNIIRTAKYTKEYLYNDEIITGVSFKTY